MITPWLIHEADLALYPAWRDGMPFRGPSAWGGDAEPVFQSKASLSISESRRPSAASAFSWTGTEPMAESSWEISVSFPDGVFNDIRSRLLSRLASGGFHILVARFMDSRSGQWSCFRWFYVTVSSDDDAESGEVMQRSLHLKSTWLQESVGSSSPPALLPTVRGEVDWICGPRRITALAYDPATETWSSLPLNEVGDGTRYVNLSPVTGSVSDIALSAYLPRVVAGDESPPALPVARVMWQNVVLANIGSSASLIHHGLALMGGTSLQASGIVEPIMSIPQDRMLDEPVLVFRFLRRVYAVLGHGVLAVPSLIEDTPPPFSHDCPFRLAIPGDPNPATGQSGLTLLPDGAWLDGTSVLLSQLHV